MIPPKNGFQKQFFPPNAKVCFGNGTPLYAPPSFNLSKIVAAGKTGGWNPFAANAAVGHYGAFDFQRSNGSAGNTTFYSGYTPVSNFALGAYLYGAGIPKEVASLIANTFAFFKSSNAGDPEQATYRNMGYDMAASGWMPQCGPK